MTHHRLDDVHGKFHVFGGVAIPVSVSLTENLIRAGVNFKFSF
jgi:hypothetical protein